MCCHPKEIRVTVHISKFSIIWRTVNRNFWKNCREIVKSKNLYISFPRNVISFLKNIISLPLNIISLHRNNYFVPSEQISKLVFQIEEMDLRPEYHLAFLQTRCFIVWYIPLKGRRHSSLAFSVNHLHIPGIGAFLQVAISPHNKLIVAILFRYNVLPGIWLYAIDRRLLDIANHKWEISNAYLLGNSLQRPQNCYQSES